MFCHSRRRFVLKKFLLTVVAIVTASLLLSCNNDSIPTGNKDAEISVTFHTPDTTYYLDIQNEHIPSIRLSGTVDISDSVAIENVQMHVENSTGEVVDSIEIKTQLSGKVTAIDLSKFYIPFNEHSEPQNYTAVISILTGKSSVTQRFSLEISNAVPTLSVAVDDSVYVLTENEDMGQSFFKPVGKITSSDTSITPKIRVTFNNEHGEECLPLTFITLVAEDTINKEANFDLSRLRLSLNNCFNLGS